MKRKVWMRIEPFGQTSCELAVSPLPERIAEMIIMSDWGTHSLSSIVNLKQHGIPGGQKEINTLIKDMLEVLTNTL